jgi:hypothetical protein
LRDIPSVQQREQFCPSTLCDVCYEYEATWNAYKQESGSKDPTEFVRLYDRLSELRKKIDELQRDATVESEKNASRRLGKNTWAQNRPE